MGVTLTGGEPLLRDDISEIVNMSRLAGLKVALATNGTLLTEKAVGELVAGGLEHFDIGFTEPTSPTRLALTAAVRSGCTVTASICIHNNNYQRAGVLINIAAALGADAVAINRFVPTGRGRLHDHKLNLSNRNLLSALELADNAGRTAGIYIYTGIPVEPCIASKDMFPGITFSTCQCGESKWAIDSRGNLRTCEQNREVLGNLLENSFAEITENNRKKIEKFRSWRPSDHCLTCNLSAPEDCRGGCRFRQVSMPVK